MRLRRRRMWIKIIIGVTVIVIAVAVTLRFINPLRSYPSKGKATPHPTINEVRMPSQPGTSVFEKGGYKIDYSHSDEGYISVIGPNDDKIKKVQVLFDTFTYTYDVGSDRYTVIPLQKGTGKYIVRTLRNTSGNAFTVTASTVIEATVKDDLTIYLYPNQIVDYDLQTLAVGKSFEITKDDDSQIQRVHTIYRYVIDVLSYDQSKADRAKDVFMLPDLDEILTTKKGICFDYAALMTAMIRVQGIPARLITGYTDIAYHAWVEIYIEDVGWINPRIYFKSEEWERVDPTFDDSFGIYFGEYQTKYTY